MAFLGGLALAVRYLFRLQLGAAAVEKITIKQYTLSAFFRRLPTGRITVRTVLYCDSNLTSLILKLQLVFFLSKGEVPCRYRQVASLFGCEERTERAGEGVN